jgi:tRNA(Ile2) C34 agmatinyltransferase TiaS
VEKQSGERGGGMNRIDICKYCNIEMETVGLYYANGWRCPKCGHTEVDSITVTDWNEVKACWCKGCVKAKEATP